MEYLGPEHGALQQDVIYKNSAIYEITSFGKYAIQHLMAEGGKIVLQETDAKVFWKKSGRYDCYSRPWLCACVPLKAHSLLGRRADDQK